MKEFKEMSPIQINENVFKLIGSDWMLITAETDKMVNTMTASWGGFGVLWNVSVAYVVIRPQRYTKKFIDNSDSFSLSFFDNSCKRQLSYLGSVSGRDEDKIAVSKLTVVHGESAPYFKEAELVVICKKLFGQPLSESGFIDKSIVGKFYPNSDFHTLYIGEITKVLVDDSRIL